MSSESWELGVEWEEGGATVATLATLVAIASSRREWSSLWASTYIGVVAVSKEDRHFFLFFEMIFLVSSLFHLVLVALFI